VLRHEHWPASLVIVRHGESAGNVAREFAEAQGHPFIDIAMRDMDVPLSELGERQAQAIGMWIATLGRRAPTVVLTSPYVRAERTASIALAAAGLDIPLVLDERLREREFGVLDRLTKAGIQERYPDQVEARARIGKFYHRPPGGESWCDVALRVRSLLDSVTREHSGKRVLIVAHQVVILLFRYVIEHLSEAEVLRISREIDLANCSVTTFKVDRSNPHGMTLERFNEVFPLEEAQAPVTREPDVPLAPR
jgi:2,3-bisphosphoglycerate-dependent phosphoglycerate mutase